MKSDANYVTKFYYLKNRKTERDGVTRNADLFSKHGPEGLHAAWLRSYRLRLTMKDTHSGTIVVRSNQPQLISKLVSSRMNRNYYSYCMRRGRFQWDKRLKAMTASR